MVQKKGSSISQTGAGSKGGPVATAMTCDDEKRCETCLGLYPLSEFRRRRRDHERRFNHCRRCHNLAERTRRTIASGRASRRRVAEIIGRLRPDDPNRKAVAVCEEMIRHYGGVSGAVRTWLKCMNHDLQKGGLAAMRHINLIFRLMAHCEPQPVDYSQMTDEELREAAIAAGLDPGD